MHFEDINRYEVSSNWNDL